MANYVNLDMTFTEICSAVLTEYKEPVAGSSAVPLDFVEDMVNTVYFDIFNKPELRSYRREDEHTFPTFENQLIADAGISIGDITVDLDDSSEWPATGTACINKSDFFAYTANDLATELSGVTGVQVDHDGGERVELGYDLPTTIDEQLLKSVAVTGLLYNFIPPSQYFTVMGVYGRTYTILEKKFYSSISTASTVNMIFEAKLTALSAVGDKPAMLDGKWRPSLLVSGVIQRIGVRDDMRTGWDWHANNYETKLKQFIAEQNNPIRSEHPSRRPSIYD